MKKHISDIWQEQFDAEFPNLKVAHPEVAFFARDVRPAVKAFITGLLTSQKQSIIEGLEGMKFDTSVPNAFGYDSGEAAHDELLDDAIKYIKEI